MNTFSLWCAVTALILKMFLLGALLSADDSVRRYGVNTKLKPIPETISPPPAAPEVIPASPPSTGHVDDTRPLVFVHSYRDSAHPDRVLCLPCESFHKWHDAHADSFPVRFEIHDYSSEQAMPQRVRDKGVPLFHWLDVDTAKTWDLVGWTNAETFLESYKQVSKLPVAGERVPSAPSTAVTPAAGESPLDVFKRLGGAGKFSWTPDKPIAGYVDDATFLSYRSVQGSVKLVSGQPFVTLSDPLPEVSVRKFGFWIKVRVLGVDGRLPDSVIVRHSMGKLRIRIEEAK